MNILVTGGAGFIGSHLCEYFLKNTDNKVYCLDNLYSSSLENIKPFLLNNKFNFIKADINTYEFLDDLKFDEIYHLACPASPKFYQKDPLFTLRTNTVGTINILELAKRCNSKILLTSTSEVYGDPLINPQPETYWGNVNCIGIRSCYDVGKRISETFFIEYNKKYNVNIRICRIFNTYGPNLNSNDGRVISNFIKQSLDNKDITIYGNGNQTRSFCYISDLINGFIALMKSNYKLPVNLGNSNEITIKNLANIIIKLTNSKSKLSYKELPKDDPKIRNPDLTLSKKILQWEPKIDIKNGLLKMIKYYKNKN